MRTCVCGQMHARTHTRTHAHVCARVRRTSACVRTRVPHAHRYGRVCWQAVKDSHCSSAYYRTWVYLQNLQPGHYSAEAWFGIRRDVQAYKQSRLIFDDNQYVVNQYVTMTPTAWFGTRCNVQLPPSNFTVLPHSGLRAGLEQQRVQRWARIDTYALGHGIVRLEFVGSDADGADGGSGGREVGGDVVSEEFWLGDQSRATTDVRIDYYN